MTGRLVLGTQIGAINGAGSRLSGSQLGLLNHAKHIEGKADNSSVKSFGLQIGLINHSRTNNGFQIGLINRAKRMRGVQVGLINLFTPSPYDGANRYNGVPIGLLNIGSTDNKLRFSMSDVIPILVEYSTGNCHNCSFTESAMPLSDIFYKTNQNLLIAGYSYLTDDDFKWAAGYGFQRVYYYKNSMSPADPINKKYFFSPSIRFIHLNREEKFDPSLSLLTQLQFEVGYRYRWIGIFAGVNLNAFFYQKGQPKDVDFQLDNSDRHQLWPGYVFGIQL
ncbi:MAG: hypothetical protein HRT61_13440 [Ekhidna sp.]|nr:hypothetical protein [Ekhidna sp.]